MLLSCWNETSSIAQPHRNCARVLLASSEICIEYKRTSPITIQEEMSREELAYYLPAIQDAYTSTGLSTLRTEAKPKREWSEPLKAVNDRLRYYLHQLEWNSEIPERS